jgi:hypothetical protein
VVSSVAGSTSAEFFFMWRNLKKDVYAVPPRTNDDFVAIFKAVVTTADASVLRCVRENAVCLEIGGGSFEYLL